MKLKVGWDISLERSVWTLVSQPDRSQLTYSDHLEVLLFCPHRINQTGFSWLLPLQSWDCALLRYSEQICNTLNISVCPCAHRNSDLCSWSGVRSTESESLEYLHLRLYYIPPIDGAAMNTVYYSASLLVFKVISLGLQHWIGPMWSLTQVFAEVGGWVKNRERWQMEENKKCQLLIKSDCS